jgi:hypothetical protein
MTRLLLWPVFPNGLNGTDTTENPYFVSIFRRFFAAAAGLQSFTARDNTSFLTLMPINLQARG